jgi:hypothetical protein
MSFCHVSFFKRDGGNQRAMHLSPYFDIYAQQHVLKS